ncbi:hypothetical protein D3C73_1154960 [compost metagenome]
MAFENAGKGDRYEIHEATDDKHRGDLRRAESVPAPYSLDEAEDHRMAHHQKTHAGDAEPHSRRQLGERGLILPGRTGDVRKSQKCGQCGSEHDARHCVEEYVRADLAH